MPHTEKPLEWIGSSHKDLLSMPSDVRRFFGFALSLAQMGDGQKSKQGIATPKPDIDLIHARLKVAEAIAKDWQS